MEHKIEVGKKKMTLHHSDLLDEINIDNEISIDYSNLAGEAYVTPLVANALGMHKADLEKEVKQLDLKIKVYEAEFKKDKRSEAAREDRRITEKELDTIYYTDREWQKMKNDLYQKESFLAKVENFYWKVQDKTERLKIYLKEVAPEEFEEHVIEKAMKNAAIEKNGLRKY